MYQSQRLFDVYIAVDWSARSVPSPAKPSKDTLWVGVFDVLTNTQQETYWRTRFECLKFVRQLLHECVLQKKRVIIGYDLDFGFPAGFIESVGLKGNAPKWKQLWELLSELVIDDETNANNRFEVAAQLNALCMKDRNVFGPLWGHPINQSHATLHFKGSQYPFITKSGHQLRKLRWTEMRESKAQPVWKLIGSASVGGQTLVGIPAVYKLRFDKDLSNVSKIWPFETGFDYEFTGERTSRILHVEIWPGILTSRLDKSLPIRDQAQVRATVEWMAELDEKCKLLELLQVPQGLTAEAQKDCIEEEGWVLGSGTRSML